GQIGSERGVEGLLGLLTQTNYRRIGDTYGRVCDWAYTTVIAILDRHVPDPGAAYAPPAPEPVVAGPWSK
ncbi:MAG: hypothetical protein GY803_32075, partial [Chloroflexi bacterium]|nr:hypothetical protein [Chloroflexota bacterium]